MTDSLVKDGRLCKLTVDLLLAEQKSFINIKVGRRRCWGVWFRALSITSLALHNLSDPTVSTRNSCKGEFMMSK